MILVAGRGGVIPSRRLTVPDRSFTLVGNMSRDFIRDFWRDDSGQGLVEYALIIAVIAIVVIAALQLVGNKGNNSLMNASNILS
jgi:pilus assembly protein Flp/PilA